MLAEQTGRFVIRQNGMQLKKLVDRSGTELYPRRRTSPNGRKVAISKNRYFIDRHRACKASSFTPSTKATILEVDSPSRPVSLRRAIARDAPVAPRGCPGTEGPEGAVSRSERCGEELTRGRVSSRPMERSSGLTTGSEDGELGAFSREVQRNGRKARRTF
ncbi:hypothetical protein MRX96_019587 [Rhipicephalus microplus]